MEAPLLQTKLYIPPPRPELVSRPRLIERLNAGLHRKLTLVSAPAGFGKTTLLSEWVAGCGRPVAPGPPRPARTWGAGTGGTETGPGLAQAASPSCLPRAEPTGAPSRDGAGRTGWVSLDEGDNDPARFLAYLIAALQTVQADVGEAALAALQSPQPPPTETILTALINEIAALPGPPGDPRGRPYILVLDDYHLITAQPIHDGLTFLLDHLSPNLHLVVATRADPPLPIARLRGRGQVTELRQSDLRFTTDEAAAFLNTHVGLNLSPDDVAALEARTEGWIAGLQMAALSMRGQNDVAGFIRAFTGSDRYILDYLVEEVLQRQPENIQTFLLQTSILNRLTGPLCDVILSRGPQEQRNKGDFEPSAPQLPGSSAPGQEILEYLERNNLFVIPLDNERSWYRYHRLFADLLRRRLQQMQPDLAPTLHRRAAGWFEGNGLTAPAIEHMLRAGDFERAASLIEEITEATLMRSELATFLGWVDELPDEVVRDRPSLCVFQAWALLLAGRPLDAVEARLQDAARSETVDKTAPLRALLALYRGQIPRASELSRRALERLPEDDLFLRDLATWILGLSHLVDGDLATSTHALDQVARMSHRAGNVMIAVMVLCNIAELRMQQGRLYQANDIYQQALEWATDEQGHLLPIAGEALMGLGNLFYQWNDLEAAARYLIQGIELTGRWGEVGAMDGYISLAHVRQAQGDVGGAREALQKAQQLALKTDVTELDDILVAAHQAHLWVAQGDLEAALRWLEERGLTVDVARTELKATDSDNFFRRRRRRTAEYTTLIRVLLAQSRPDEALTVLMPLLVIAERWGLNERVIRFQILRALAFHAQDDMAQGMAAVERALSLAEPSGYVRIFLDEGEPMARLLYRAAECGIAPEYAGRLLAAFPAWEPLDRDPQAEIVEPLSERELDVLCLIAEGLSNQEIAQRLSISTRTVKWHTSNILGKLGVKNRTQAVAKARSLGVLPAV
jgi:LuxR family maltose regulon positive regulatory protein